MRNQYYGDSRDVFKWSVLLRLIRTHRIRAVLQVAMLRPDDGSAEGGTRHEPGVVEPSVRAFFDAERRAFERDPALRHIGRISRLASACGGGFDIEVVDRVFTRVGYFAGVVSVVTSLSSPALVFLDPDTGMGQGMGPRRHFQIRDKEVVQVFAALRSGDVLALYQHGWRQADWVAQLKERFRASVGGLAVQYVAERDIAIFSALKCRAAD